MRRIVIFSFDSFLRVSFILEDTSVQNRGKHLTVEEAQTFEGHFFTTRASPLYLDLNSEIYSLYECFRNALFLCISPKKEK